MKIGLDGKGHIVLKEVYSGILFETEEGNRLGLCMRDDTFEINVMPKGEVDHCWQRVNMQTKNITREFIESDEADDLLTDGEGGVI
jgi:hypothetical protein